MRYVLLLGLAVAACGRAGPPPVPASLLARAESLYLETRDLADRLDVMSLQGRGQGTAARITGIRYRAVRRELGAALQHLPRSLADSVDTRALLTMRRVLADELVETPEPAGVAPDGATPDCRYDAAKLSLDSLASRLYACYGAAAHGVVRGADTLDRLTVLGLLGEVPDSARRRQLFLALDPLWRTVNGDGGPASPWRTLLVRRARTWRGETPFAQRVREFGIVPDTAVAWLAALLDAWRAILPDTTVEPWDLWYWLSGADRRLSPRIPRAALGAITRRYYRDLGADPDSLGIAYDVEPRAGKDPVAFTTFGARRPISAYVSATYERGGFGNLGELLHETGHGIHITGIETRAAFADWPASDLFTEAIADLAVYEMYEAPWQLKYLGDSAATADNLRARYFGVVMDATWALFEERMQRDPGADPNQVWTELTRRYLRVAPHPELSWWAMRGQLIDVPGYMVNYALGAFVVTDLRTRIRALHGAFTTGDTTWYPWVRERIYRFGLERDPDRVVRDFLGRGVGSAALLADLARAAR